jgi:hypothetical protein
LLKGFFPGSSTPTPPKVLLRPLLALAAAFASNPDKPFDADVKQGEVERLMDPALILFCSAIVPPGKAVLEDFKEVFGSWKTLLSRQSPSGLWTFLRYGTTCTTDAKYLTAVGDKAPSLVMRARTSFLQSMEMQHQMFARCSVPELGELKTTEQSFKAKVEVETTTLFPNDSFWTWRDLMPQSYKHPELEFTLKDSNASESELGIKESVGFKRYKAREEEEAVDNLLPKSWGMRNDVHLKKTYESDPCHVSDGKDDPALLQPPPPFCTVPHKHSLFAPALALPLPPSLYPPTSGPSAQSSTGSRLARIPSMTA